MKRVTWRVVAGYVHEAGDVAGRRGFRSRNGWPDAADWVSRGSKRGGMLTWGPTQTTWRVVAGYVCEGGDVAGGRRFPSRNG